MRPRHAGLLAGALSALLAGCNAQEMLSKIDPSSVARAAKAVGKTFQEITPEQEYYVGRAVAATILTQYAPWENDRATRYVTLLGQTLAQFSDRPETFGGYHFMILDTDEVNAFAAPGGHIFVSRGMLRLAKSEDALAAVLAHEIAHVVGRHGLQAIKKSRVTDALTVLAAEGAKTFGNEDLAKLTETFEGSIADVTSTLTNNGYSRGFEREADRQAVAILSRVGYDPRALHAVLDEMDKVLAPGGLGFAKTHPDPADRIDDLEDDWKKAPTASPVPAARQQRFARALAGV